MLVLFGGRSAEADVSVVSGTAIADALLDAGVQVAQAHIARDGTVRRLAAGHRRGEQPPSTYTDLSAPALIGVPTESLEQLLAHVAASAPTTIVVPALHGPGDEDGSVVAVAGALGLNFVGDTPTVAALGMQKPQAKAAARACGIPTLPDVVVDAVAWKSDRRAVLDRLAAFADLHAPTGALIGKPTAHGSSIGMRIARNPGEWPAAIDEALRYGERALLEPYLERARELEVAVLERRNGSVQSFGPGEVFPGHEFYDYEAKYAPGVSRTATESDLPASVRAALRSASTDLFAAIGSRGLSRMDFLMARSGDRAGHWYFSEVNTFPGFTPISLFPALVMAAGSSFQELCLELVDVAARRPALRVPR